MNAEIEIYGSLDPRGALARLDRMDAELALISEIPFVSRDMERGEAHPSDMTLGDVCLALAFGAVGGMFSSSEKIKSALHDIHQSAAKKTGDGLLGKLLQHYQHDMDQTDMPDGTRRFIKRDGSFAGPLHRLFFGHDPFSTSGDNPFILGIRQYGLIRGIIRSSRHLLADSFSKQGLPLPFHSYLDYQGPAGMTNWLHTWSSAAARESGLSFQETFSELFTIKAQDIMSSGLAWGLCQAYFKLAGIEDEIRTTQVKLLSYTTSFATTAATGFVTRGVPRINWPMLTMAGKEFVALLVQNHKEIRELEIITDEMLALSAGLGHRVCEAGEDLPTHEDPGQYLREVRGMEGAVMALADSFFEED